MEKLNNRTCNCCKYYLPEMFHCKKNDVMSEAHQTCEDFEQKKKTTNGDKIRSMSDEELAELLTNPPCFICSMCDVRGECTDTPLNNQTCKEAILARLKQEVKE